MIGEMSKEKKTKKKKMKEQNVQKSLGKSFFFSNNIAKLLN